MRLVGKVFCVMLGLFLLSSCGPVSRDSAEGPGSSDSPCETAVQNPEGMDIADQRVLSFNFQGYGEDGKKEWEVFGDTANIVNGMINLDQVRAKAFTENGEVNISARKGEFDNVSRNMVLRDDVHIATSDGINLFTNVLCWASETEEITTDEQVKITKDNVTTYGKGAVAKSKLKQVTLKEEIKVDMKPSTVITCDGPFDVDYENGIAVFNNNVIIEDKDGTVTADKMIAYFNKDTREMDKVEAIGNVVIERGGNRSFSEKAIYDTKTAKVRLVGRPKIVIDSNDDIKGFGFGEGLNSIKKE